MATNARTGVVAVLRPWFLISVLVLFSSLTKALRISAEHVLELLHGLVRRRSAAGRIDAVRGMFVGGVWVFASVSVRDLPNLRA